MSLAFRFLMNSFCMCSEEICIISTSSDSGDLGKGVTFRFEQMG
jgi:hypothetical protein